MVAYEVAQRPSQPTPAMFLSRGTAYSRANRPLRFDRFGYAGNDPADSRRLNIGAACLRVVAWLMPAIVAQRAPVPPQKLVGAPADRRQFFLARQ
jgi:hypothetical protein